MTDLFFRPDGPVEYVQSIGQTVRDGSGDPRMRLAMAVEPGAQASPAKSTKPFSGRDGKGGGVGLANMNSPCWRVWGTCMGWWLHHPVNPRLAPVADVFPLTHVVYR